MLRERKVGFGEKRGLTAYKRARDGEYSKPDGSSHERLLPSIKVGESAEEEQQASLMRRGRDERLGGQWIRETHRCERV